MDELERIIHCFNRFYDLQLVSVARVYAQRSGKPKKLRLKKILIDYRTILTNFKFWVYTLFFCFLLAALVAWNTLSPFYLMGYLKLNLIQFGYIQLYVYGFFIIGINLRRLLKNYPMEKIMKGGVFLTIFTFTLALLTLMYSPQRLLWVMGSVLMFCMSTGSIFYLLNRKAIEIPKAPMGTITAVFSTAMHLFGFLGSLAARTLYF